jgi:hypothetical protein
VVLGAERKEMFNRSVWLCEQSQIFETAVVMAERFFVTQVLEKSIRHLRSSE